LARLLAEARAIHAEDIAANRRMGELGAALLDERGAVLTDCNTGSLATGGYGTDRARCAGPSSARTGWPPAVLTPFRD